MNSQFKHSSLGQKAGFNIKQRGVVLFFALIALVVMSLAAVALIRSVDTSTLIAGNLASKQSATSSADSGIETAVNWMTAVTDPTNFDSNNAASGYYATQAADPKTLVWNATDSLPATSTATGADAIVGGLDATGNTIRYVIQRMCRTTGVPAVGNCLFGSSPANTSSQAVRNETEAGGHANVSQSPVYRITARVIGAKNTVSFVQAFVY